MMRENRVHHFDLRRRGTAMIVAIIALLLVTTICFSLVRMAVAASQQAERQSWQVQSGWLAESALAHGAARLRNDADFTGDDWTIENVGAGRHRGRVNVTIAAADDNPRRRTMTAVADFPDDATDRVRTTRTLTLDVESE